MTRRYGSERNERWQGFEHRPGDIVISTRSKCGTTWMQMICALLVFQRPELPAPLAEISPWLDWDVEPLATVTDRLGAQRHRRIIKTHTPLDGIPLQADVTYIVMGRQPLDVAVSLYHHAANLDRQRTAQLTGDPVVASPVEPLGVWLPEWLATDVAPEVQLDTLRGLVHHVRDAAGRHDEVDVVMVHYDDLARDTEAQMRQLAAHLDIVVADSVWPDLVGAASFDSMKRRSSWHVPDRLGVLRDPDAFFRSGRSGEGAAVLSDDELEFYERRLHDLAGPELAHWLHHGGDLR